MKIQNTRERLLASSMICGAAFLGLSATQSYAAAEACVADRPRKAAPQIIEEANRRSRVELIFKVYILQRSSLKGRPAPQQCCPRTEVDPGYAGVTGVSNRRSTNISLRQ